MASSETSPALGDVIVASGDGSLALSDRFFLGGDPTPTTGDEFSVPSAASPDLRAASLGPFDDCCASGDASPTAERTLLSSGDPKSMLGKNTKDSGDASPTLKSIPAAPGDASPVLENDTDISSDDAPGERENAAGLKVDFAAWQCLSLAICLCEECLTL